MILFLLSAVIISILCLKQAKNVKEDYMSANMTNSIKGFFLIMVFLSHIYGYTDFNNTYLDVPYQTIRKITGQCIVTMFLFYSGFGMMESIKKKGENYINAIPFKRFLNVLFQFDTAVICFWIYRVLIQGNHYSAKHMILTFVAWNGIGNSNWYIFCVLWIYIFLYLSGKVFWKGEKSYKYIIMSVFICSIIYMAVMNKVGREHWWYDTILSFPFGMAFSVYRTNIENVVSENRKTWIYSLLISMISFYLLYAYKGTNIVIYEGYIMSFVCMILIFTMRFVIDSRILRWIGNNLFPLYIFQRLPMMSLKESMLYEDCLYITKMAYVVLCFLITIVATIIYNATIKKGIDHLVLGISNLWNP